MIKGNIVFGGNIENTRLIEYMGNSPEKDYSGCVIYVAQLTNEIALMAIEKAIAGIITGVSSFATHGANILRSYFATGIYRIPWLTNVSRNSVTDLFGCQITINNGYIYTRNELQQINKREMTKIDYIPILNRTIVEYNSCINETKICYWPHRRYDLFTFSIMKVGLQKNCKWLFKKSMQVELDKEGHIWFKNGLYLRDIVEFAKDYRKSAKYLKKQIDTYYNILNKVEQGINLDTCIFLLEKYFSVFILYHNTYEQIFQDAFELIKTKYDEDFAVKVMDELLYCDLDKWMLDKELALEKGKSFFSDEPLVPIPDFTIYDDIDHKQNSFFQFFKQHQKLSFYKDNKEQIRYWVTVFVTKEWKFVINKILFTNCADLLRSFCSEHKLTSDDIQNLDVENLYRIWGKNSGEFYDKADK